MQYKYFYQYQLTVKPMKKLIISALVAALAFGSTLAMSAWNKDESIELDAKAKEALTAFRKEDSSVDAFINQSVGYVVIPTVGKAGFGIGGARGKGVLYENGAVTAVVTLSQLSIGFQWGGQAYSEFVFFQDTPTLTNFKKGDVELGAQASAVAVTAGVSADAAFVDGMAIFTQAKGGLMYEAAIGGQKFKVELK